MPVFLPSTVQDAVVKMDVDPAGVPCRLQLYLAATPTGTKVAQTAMVDFVSTGALQNVPVSLTMPAQGGAGYNVYVAWYYNDGVSYVLAEIFEDVNDVLLISYTPPVITW